MQDISTHDTPTRLSAPANWLISGIFYVLNLALAHSVYASGIERPLPVSEANGCVVIPLKTEVDYFSSPTPGDSSIPPINGMADTMYFEKRDMFLIISAAGCAQLKDASNTLFHAYNSVWLRRDEFVPAESLERIRHWTTRYVYRRTFLSGGGAEELGMDPRRVSSEMELEAYRVNHIQDPLHLFTPDGYYIDMKNHMRWEMRWSPWGNVILIDPSGRSLPTSFAFSSDFNNVCERDPNGDLRCGLQFQWQTCADARNELGQCPPSMERPSYATGTTPVALVGRIQTELKESEAFEELPDRIRILQRFGPRKAAGYALSFYAKFDDPIKPVVFAPGVLFTPKAKVRTGRARKSDLVMRETCIADCPDLLQLQGLTGPASAP